MNFEENRKSLAILANLLSKAKITSEKLILLERVPQVAKTLSEGTLQRFLPTKNDLETQIAILAVVAIDQHKRVFGEGEKEVSIQKVQELQALLVSIEHFYAAIGGIVGYHVHVLNFLSESKEPRALKRTFLQAEGLDLTQDSEDLKSALKVGIEALAEMGEIYPIGGLGSRLNALKPVACLSFCGRTLLEGLVRDTQAREFLYSRLFGKQITIPIAMMTSQELGNAGHIKEICVQNKWFGRSEESFFLFTQLSVPVVTKEGNWSVMSPLELAVQPGGHGALWKAAEEKGVFAWLQKLNKKHVLLRQINNPIAGLDLGLLALVGQGKKENKAFGFASCERLPNAAEGVLVLVNDEETLRISNIEYHELKEHGIHSHHNYPANTNILYANLEKILPVIEQKPLPGLMLNMKNYVSCLDEQGKKKEILGGRLESMMQNMSDALTTTSLENLPTFLTYNARIRTISVTKKNYEGGAELLETPEGAFYDLQLNAHMLLEKCGSKLPSIRSQKAFLDQGPAVLFLYHPALGPLYSIIVEKLQRLEIKENSELQLEIADMECSDLSLDGSLLIEAKNCLGSQEEGVIQYNNQTGKCVLKNVRVKNEGIDRQKTESYWRNEIVRKQSLSICLEGRSEFYAENVLFEGDVSFVVPAGERWIFSQDEQGKVTHKIECANWHWESAKNLVT
ncbi:MAG: hypothetical protein S4CHLAM123_04410 [Chlamydiales bacterium]|nr:hypothetical protein [Chlamydiales bacterium]